MVLLGILILSILLQLAAAVYALRLMRLTGWGWIWMLVSLALILMNLRRAIVLERVLGGEATNTDWIIEGAGLLISALLLVGVIGLGWLFRQLRVSQEQFRNIFEYSPLGIALVSPADQRIVQANQSICKLLGYTEAELTQLTVADITHPEDMAREAVELEAIRNGSRPTYTIEKRYRAKDGSLRWVNLAVGLLPAESKHLRLALGMVEDITGRKQAETIVKRQMDLLASIRQV